MWKPKSANLNLFDQIDVFQIQIIWTNEESALVDQKKQPLKVFCIKGVLNCLFLHNCKNGHLFFQMEIYLTKSTLVFFKSKFSWLNRHSFFSNRNLFDQIDNFFFKSKFIWSNLHFLSIFKKSYEESVK